MTADSREPFLVSLVLLMTGLAVYVFARPESIISLSSVLPGWSYSLPSLLHTCAFATLIGLCARSRGVALFFAASWGLVEVAAELLQLLPPPKLTLLSYRVQWTFDLFDLVACIVGTGFAVILLGFCKVKNEP